MKVLHVILVKHVSLFTTKTIMNVTAPVEAPRNPAINLVSAIFILWWDGVGEFIKEHVHLNPKL